MLASIDIETRGLDSTKFIMGTIHRQDNITKTFYKKQELWDYILKLAEREQKRRKVLTIWSHNANYDFFGYADITDRNIIYNSINPFIVTYKKDKDVIIRFLDSYSLFRLPLQKAAKLIGESKLETPKELYIEDSKIEIPFDTLNKIREYNINDTIIVTKLIKEFKRKLAKMGLKPKRIFTIHQIAISYLMNRLSKQNLPFFYKQFVNKKGKTIQKELIWTRHKKIIHNAYRGGWVNAFKIGKYENSTLIDCNSCYTYSAINMQFPNLNTETMRYKPLQTYSQRDLLSKIGISEVLIYNQSNNYAPLPVRTDHMYSYHPKSGKYIIGTYTHIELRELLKHGYKIIQITKSLIYKQAPFNPLKDHLDHLYNLRIKSKSEFDKYLYKQLMNSSFGKMAQHLPLRQYKLDTMELAPYYFKKGYDAIKSYKYDYLYRRLKPNTKYKPYYCPIIPTLINAYARIYMFKNIRKIPIKDLLYTDTDSILFKGNYKNRFNISKKLGSFKIEHENKTAIIYAKKTYSIGNEVKVSGFHKKDLNIDDFQKGQINSTKLFTLNTAYDLSQIGKPQRITRDLNSQLEIHKSREKDMQNRKLYIDANITDLTEYHQNIQKISEEQNV